ncbi:unannotated protein [freshwater metagenome]|uniref:Unannotated protein n=2 Tax=freshwater metagenome TaxID=449393 RepID=A0A6J6B8D4_9ZZZZ
MTEIKLSESAALLMETRGLGELATRMGIELTELSAERSVATMPAEGNRQPLGLVNGGAYLVLGETLGSISANVWASSFDKVAVGIEISASHSKSCREGTVTAVCTSISLGKTLTVHEIVCSDESGARLSTVRITNLIRDKQ